MDLLKIIQLSARSKPVSLDQLWVDYGSQWQQLDWNRAQLSLWLSCNPAFQRLELPNGEWAWGLNSEQKSGDHNLADELVALLQKAGRPMPLAQLASKLPAGMVVTEPMLRSAAQQDTRLELKGPLLKLA